MKKLPLLSLTSVFALLLTWACQDKTTAEKAPALYFDAMRQPEAQPIPGRLQCEYFDLGGEGTAYHDSDATNSGSGSLNKGTDYLSTFRVNEAVDLSFTKFHDSIDNSAYNLVDPEEGQLYVGWTEPGEWTRYTVDVQTTGTYQVGLMYTANADGQIALSINGEEVSGPLTVRSTFDAADSIPWRQWHHWNYEKNLAEIPLKKGLQTLTLHTVDRGQMNYDFLEFTLKTKP